MLQILLECGYEVDYPLHSELDISDFSGMRKYLSARDYDCIVNCAAIVNKDWCNDHPQMALQVNSISNVILSDYCSYLVYISTASVLSCMDPSYGNRDIYANTKRAGELIVMSSADRYLIVRTAAVYGDHSMALTTKVLSMAGNREPIWGSSKVASPTYNKHLSNAVCDMIDKGDTGIAHITNAGTCTYCQFIRELLDLAGYNNITVEYRVDNTPPNSILATRELPLWRDALADYVYDVQRHAR
jgi:dTDP-4-dehydrorhamnose reductase